MAWMCASLHRAAIESLLLFVDVVSSFSDIVAVQLVEQNDLLPNAKISVIYLMWIA